MMTYCDDYDYGDWLMMMTVIIMIMTIDYDDYDD